MSIAHIYKNIKSIINKLKYYLPILIIILFSVLSYQMGHIGKLHDNNDKNKENTSFEYLDNFNGLEELGTSPDTPNSAKNEPKIEDYPIYASKNGSKYYFANCSGLGRIKAENLVGFNTEKEAQERGYEIALNCNKK